jgi:hypothetical protein
MKTLHMPYLLFNRLYEQIYTKIVRFVCDTLDQGGKKRSRGNIKAKKK